MVINLPLLCLILAYAKGRLSAQLQLSSLKAGVFNVDDIAIVFALLGVIWLTAKWGRNCS